MNARKLAIVGLLAVSLATAFSAPQSVEAGTRTSTRGAHYRVTMYWVHRQTRQQYTTAMTVTYYWSSGLSSSDRWSLANHVRNMNRQGWYGYNYRYEHPRYF